MPHPKTLDLLNSPLEGTNLIEASAGTGKTYTVTALFLRLVLEKARERRLAEAERRLGRVEAKRLDEIGVRGEVLKRAARRALPPEDKR